MAYITAIGLAALVFAGTNMDNLLLLVMFLANRQLPPRQVILGHYLGGTILIATGILCALVTYIVPSGYIGLLGIVPLSLGLYQFIERFFRRPKSPQQMPPRPRWTALVFTGICLAHGGDNIVVYASLFATANTSLAKTILIVAVFLLMMTLWLMIAHALLRHPSLGDHLRRFLPWISPFVLIAFGLWFLSKIIMT